MQEEKKECYYANLSRGWEKILNFCGIPSERQQRVYGEERTGFKTICPVIMSNYNTPHNWESVYSRYSNEVNLARYPTKEEWEEQVIAVKHRLEKLQD